MAKTTAPFKLELGNAEFEKKVLSFDWSASIDAPAALTIQIAYPKPEKRLSAKGLPVDGKLSWNGRAAFQGQLDRFEWLSPFKLQLHYSDPLAKASKIQKNILLNQQSLQGVLQSLATEMKVQAEFVGSFSQKLPSINVGNGDMISLLSSLSFYFGFFFFFRPDRQKLVFISLGKTIGSHAWNKASREDRLVQFGSSRTSTTEWIPSASIGYFDPDSLSQKHRTFSSDQLYGNLQPFMGHATFSEKKAWPLHSGEFHASVADKFHFESGEQSTAAQLGKRAMFQDELHIRLREVSALPGDGVEVAELPVGPIPQGKYFLKALQCRARSTKPTVLATLMRP